jgi:hypothetical protein
MYLINKDKNNTEKNRMAKNLNMKQDSKTSHKFLSIFYIKYVALTFFAVFLFFGLTTKASAVNYCVSETGSATKINSVVANIAACTSASNTGAMSVSTFNAGGFVAGDIVYFTTTGGNFTNSIVIPSSGTTLNTITYQGIGDGTGGATQLLLQLLLI